MKKALCYEFGNSPDWADQLTDQKLEMLMMEDEALVNAKAAGKGICYVNNETVQTSELANHFHVQKAWLISNTNMLQGASVSEFQLRKNEHFTFHRLAVFRNGKWIDKREDVIIRVLDDEKNSQSGSIDKRRKLNVLISDLRLGDVMLEEYSTKDVFEKNDFMDHAYFRYNRLMPVGYWFYRSFSFRCINERDATLRVDKRYFTDSSNIRIPIEKQRISRGESFVISLSNHSVEQPQNSFIPEIEIANDETWEGLSKFITEHFSSSDVHEKLEKHRICKDLRLTDGAIDLDERIRCVIDYVQNEVVYLYDAEVMHGHLPENSVTTIERRAGDCKAKSILLTDLLEVLGVESDILMVNYDYDYFLSSSIPSPFVFNHMIVRVRKDGREYIVDPTWTNRAGILGKRTEPLFFASLAISPDAKLHVRDKVSFDDLVLEEKINVVIRKGVARISIRSKCSRNSADNFRNLVNNNGLAEVIRTWNGYVAQVLSFAENRSMDTLFTDVSLKVINDDLSLNQIEVQHELTLDPAYQSIDGSRVFKFYHQLSIDGLINYVHRDAPFAHFIGYPSTYVLTIDSDLFILRGSTTKRETQIKNDYFEFSNKKSISLRKIVVSSEFKQKNYEYIPSTNLDALKVAYKKIVDSNFGVGVIYVTPAEYLIKRWYLILVLFWSIPFLVGFIDGIFQ